MKPDSSTCRILLKSLEVQRKHTREHVEKIVAMFDSLGKEASEIFGLFLETCLRTDHCDLLRCCLERQRGSTGIVVKDSITYAHLIRAYGVLEDVDGAWHAWNQMMWRNMTPLRVTLGCMVQALVTNKHVDAGYALVRKLEDKPRTSSLVTAVVYNSLLKGFVVQKMFERTWALYTEMRGRDVERTLLTFNILMDACAKCCRMDRIQDILDDMKARGVEPDNITFNTAIKGFCHDKQLQEALALREIIRRSNVRNIDGHAYAGLLDGCSRMGKWELGFELIDEMIADRVVPNNVTLTALVRLAGCSRKQWALNRAFELCEQLSRQHGIKLNGFVYKNMVTACVTHGEKVRLFKVLALAASAGFRIDSTMYEPMLLAMASERDMQQDAASLLLLAFGLEVSHAGVHALIRGVPKHALCAQDGLGARLVEKVLTTMAAFDRERPVHLARLLERESGLRLDNKVKLQLASASFSQYR